MHAVAITDHNTAGWCDAMAEAARGTPLVVLPGVELSTAEGHLLAIWDEGTPAQFIEDVLVELGILRADHGDLHKALRTGFAETAKIVAARGGLVIAAHADREKGLLRIPVADHVNQTMLDPAIAAIEIVDIAEAEKIRTRLDGKRDLAVVRSSDTTASGASAHVLHGIGNRRTWIKASRPDLRGLRHALADPSLRIRLVEPAMPEHTVIESVTVTGGFLDGQQFEFSGDLNCLLGGTGAGKSLLIELVRIALDQQTDADDFPQVRKEVESRLKYALTSGSTVEVVLTRGQARCIVRRAYFEDGSTQSEFVGDTEQLTGLSGRIAITGFSQSEVIEYARTPVGRMALIDSALDLTEFEIRETDAVARLNDNGRLISGLESKIAQAKQKLQTLPDVEKRLAELSDLFDGETVKMQASWSSEKALFDTLVGIPELKVAARTAGGDKFRGSAAVAGNQDLYERAQAAYTQLNEAIDAANAQLSEALLVVNKELAAIRQEWLDRYKQFDHQLAEAVSRIDVDNKGLSALRTRLIELQTEKAKLNTQQTQLNEELLPSLTTAKAYREELISELLDARKARRRRREERIKALNKLMGGIVRIKMLPENDDSAYLADLSAIAKGSRLRSPILQQICQESTPVKLVRSFLAGDVDGVCAATGVERKHIETLFEHVTEKGTIEDFLQMQTLDLHDGLSVEFRKHSNDGYVPIERLAHGQKCTAILIMALADGNEPLIIDQPEDALHAPWIEEYLVAKLRDLRGSRQYIFATRSPGLVVSADAEMIITLTSDATNGVVEATGSLERHDLNVLALYHLEGGPVPFKRRTVKLASSMS
ncbi:MULTISPECIES: Nuclease sbcCD subunit C [unclassified Micromonospora]|uniref:Nuclease sbcCD subunit C n=1 Tax=unclassified Micromonospora TaxID=2617518 RepID=UPI001C21A0E1|nr:MULTISPECIES: Nuclease sbcCD subunit C [unclassified Micromonospora]MBU8855752.1 Nuclease sbcCD subunit C [Micromonospora sp. WMMB482]MBU8857637.1 Nuclease sbcCD subunit C [Micromonospora sp. WMMB482]MDM4777733.1 Nuclease sbcCD subunit C [Micromonospora sp. b486]MDM4783265.1 Nuclease sbcCD subunit C [Micromonospora sp. b486]